MEGAAIELLMKKKGRLYSNLRWQFVANIAQAALGGLFLLALGMLLGVEGFGQYSITTALVSVAFLFFDARIQDVVAKNLFSADEKSISGVEHRTLLFDLFVLECLLKITPLLGVILTTEYLASFSQLPSDGVYWIILAALGVTLSKSGAGLATGVLRVLGRTDLIALFMSMDWGFKLLSVLGVAWLATLNVALALWVIIVIGGITNGVQLYVAHTLYSEIHGGDCLDWSFSGLFGRVGAHGRIILTNIGVSGSDAMSKDLDVALISSLLTAEQVGGYKMAKSIVQVVWRAVDPIYLAIMPEVQKLWHLGDRKMLFDLLRKLSLAVLVYAGFISTVTCFGIYLFDDLLVGKGYGDLLTLVLVMITWVVWCAPLLWGHPLSVAIDKPEFQFYGGLLGTGVGLVAFYFLTPALGVVGSGVAWSLTLVVGFSFTATASIFRARRQ